MCVCVCFVPATSNNTCTCVCVCLSVEQQLNDFNLSKSLKRVLLCDFNPLPPYIAWHMMPSDNLRCETHARSECRVDPGHGK